MASTATRREGVEGRPEGNVRWDVVLENTGREDGEGRGLEAGLRVEGLDGYNVVEWYLEDLGAECYADRGS